MFGVPMYQCQKCGVLKDEQIDLSDDLVCPTCKIVRSPSHYIAEDGTNVKDVIKSFKLGFNLGNVIKYVLRAGKKGDKAIDLKKAVEYLNFELEELQEKTQKSL